MRDYKVAKGFVVAMRGSIGLADCRAPQRVTLCRHVWIIVSRWGGSGEFLTVSLTAAGAELDSAEAPPSLAPALTGFGRLAPDPEGRPERTFLFARQLPKGLPVGGGFLPAEGYARLEMHEGGLRLTAAGRYARTVGPDGPPDLPRGGTWCRAPGVRGGKSWWLSARHRRWIGEVLGS